MQRFTLIVAMSAVFASCQRAEKKPANNEQAAPHDNHAAKPASPAAPDVPVATPDVPVTPPTPATPAKVIEVRAECNTVATVMAPDGAAPPKIIAQARKALGETCTEMNWTADEVKCFSTAKGGPEFMKCMPPERLQAMQVSVQERMKPPAIPAPADVAAPPADAQKTASGLAYKVLQKGTGTAHPTATSRVKVHYTGWTTDGKMFDSSVARGEPSQFSLTQVIQGWTEGLQLMVVGEKTRFWIPVDLAYQGRPGKPAGMLVFDVEMLELP